MERLQSQDAGGVLQKSTTQALETVGVVLDETTQKHMKELIRRLDQLMSVKLCWEEVTNHIVSVLSPKREKW